VLEGADWWNVVWCDVMWQLSTSCRSRPRPGRSPGYRSVDMTMPCIGLWGEGGGGASGRMEFRVGQSRSLLCRALWEGDGMEGGL
jgi:hypothetical protein